MLARFSNDALYSEVSVFFVHIALRGSLFASVFSFVLKCFHAHLGTF